MTLKYTLAASTIAGFALLAGSAPSGAMAIDSTGAGTNSNGAIILVRGDGGGGGGHGGGDIGGGIGGGHPGVGGGGFAGGFGGLGGGRVSGFGGAHMGSFGAARVARGQFGGDHHHGGRRWYGYASFPYYDGDFGYNDVYDYDQYGKRRHHVAHSAVHHHAVRHHGTRRGT
jgi:hypothetical protein